MKRRIRVKPIIYTNVSSWNALGNPTELRQQGYPLWVANWDVLTAAGPGRQLGAASSWRIWQHSSDGRVAGIKGNVDLDMLRGGWSGVTVRHPAGPVIPN